MHLVSVIVPIYRVEKYMRRCIDSILVQTYKDLEVILIDDGSPDDCGKICDEYAKKDARIKVIHKENGGLSSARNVGLDVATGEYISFVDGDDFISPIMIQTMVEKLEENSAELCICGFQYTDEDGNFLQKSTKAIIQDGVMSREIAISKLNGYYVIACNKLYKKQLFSHLRFKEGKIHEDEFIMHYIFDRCKTIVTLSERFYFYVQQPRSIMNSAFSVKRLDGAWALYDRYLFFKSKGEKRFAKKAAWQANGVLMVCLSNLPYKENKKAIDPIFWKIYKAMGFNLRKIKLILVVIRVRMRDLFASHSAK